MVTLAVSVLRKPGSGDNAVRTVGIITPYASQNNLVLELLKGIPEADRWLAEGKLEVHSVDGFQVIIVGGGAM